MPDYEKTASSPENDLYTYDSFTTGGKPKSGTHFLWWCAGADVKILNECPTDYTRYTALGMMMLVVPSLAAVSFAFFVIQTFGIAPAPAAFVGVAWGFFV